MNRPLAVKERKNHPEFPTSVDRKIWTEKISCGYKHTALERDKQGTFSACYTSNTQGYWWTQWNFLLFFYFILKSERRDAAFVPSNVWQPQQETRKSTIISFSQNDDMHWETLVLLWNLIFCLNAILQWFLRWTNIAIFKMIVAEISCLYPLTGLFGQD